MHGVRPAESHDARRGRTACQGSGRFPSADPWGKPFTKTYFPQRAKVANELLAEGFFGVYDGIQCDQEFLKKIFSLQRPLGAHRSSRSYIYILYTELSFLEHLRSEAITHGSWYAISARTGLQIEGS